MHFTAPTGYISRCERLAGFISSTIYCRAWIVLDEADGKTLLLAKDCLASLPWHNDRTAVTWDQSALRTWLNGMVDQPLTATGIVTYMGLDIHNLPSMRLSDDVNGLVYVHPCLRSEAEYEGIQVGDTVTVTGSFHILSNDWGVVLKNSTVTK